MDINVTINAPGLENAINNLAAAITAKQCGPATVVNTQPVAATVATIPENAPAAYIGQPSATPQAVVPVTPVAQAQQPAPQAAPLAAHAAAPVAAVPTTAPAYNMDQLAVAATQLVDAGRRNELVQLLAQFGVQALTELPKDYYGNFATHLRAMGAKI